MQRIIAALALSGASAFVAPVAKTSAVARASDATETAAPAKTGFTYADLKALAKEQNPIVGYFDPLELGDKDFWEQGNEATIGFLREAEIKHGRICMLAWTGFVATDLGFTLPGDMHQVSSVEAHDVACKYGAMQQIFLWLSFIEVVHSFGVAQMMWMGSDRQPGDFGLDPLDFCSTPEKAADMKLKEITHCRLAMFAFSGVVTQAVLTGKGFPYF